MSKLETNTIDNISGSSTLKLGDTNATTLDFDTGITSVTNIPNALTNTPAFLAQRSSQQSIPNSTATTIIFNNEIFDTDNAYSTTTGEFTVPSGKAGKYYFYGQVRLATTGDGTRLAGIIKVNGTDKSTVNNGHFDEDSVTVSALLDLSAADQVKFSLFQNTGGTRDTKTADNVLFQGFRLVE